MSVKTLHSLLTINIESLRTNKKIAINYVNDDPFDKNDSIKKCLKTTSRIVNIDYGIGVDNNTIVKFFQPTPTGFNGVVFPTVTEGIDWSMFSEKVKKGSDEPISQAGLNFDTEVSKKIDDDFYMVKSTVPAVWMIDTKSFLKNMRVKKGEGVHLPVKKTELFKKIEENGIKLCAYVKSKISVTYTHECLGNILNAAGVQRVD
tara:strand:+ start:466 stop:1074 length:609 start_codon:yes stop_codon:yes gene_type:complete